MATNAHYSVDALASFAASLLLAAGMDDEKAHTVARLLILTDMMGRRTHGLAIVPLYIDDIRKGAMQVTGRPEAVRDTGATMLWDGAYLPGLWLVNRAIDAAIARVAGFGVVTVSIRREERNRTLVAWPAPDRATYAARSLNGVYVRVPALCRASRRNATRVRPAYPGSRPARVP